MFMAGLICGLSSKHAEQSEVNKVAQLQEDLAWYQGANALKHECLEHADSAVLIVEDLMLDGIDSDYTYTGQDFEDALEEHGFYRHAEAIDSLCNLEEHGKYNNYMIIRKD